MSGDLKNRVRLSITLARGTDTRVRQLAEAEGRTISEVIEELIERSLGDAEAASEFRRDPLLDRLVEKLTSPEQLARARRALGREAANELKMDRTKDPENIERG